MSLMLFMLFMLLMLMLLMFDLLVFAQGLPGSYGQKGVSGAVVRSFLLINSRYICNATL